MFYGQRPQHSGDRCHPSGQRIHKNVKWLNGWGLMISFCTAVERRVKLTPSTCFSRKPTLVKKKKNYPCSILRNFPIRSCFFEYPKPAVRIRSENHLFSPRTKESVTTERWVTKGGRVTALVAAFIPEWKSPLSCTTNEPVPAHIACAPKPGGCR